MMSGWNCRVTVDLYERFCDRHDRYRVANEQLSSHAGLAPGMVVLDLGAGTGRTAEVFLPALGCNGRIFCVEPADAMRERGAARLADSRVQWCDRLPELETGIDRIVCGAAIWQLEPLDWWLGELARRLSPDGQLLFNIPALYLGIPDPPGTGPDPDLFALPAWLQERMPAAHPPPPESPSGTCLSIDQIEQRLDALGMTWQHWSFRTRMTEQLQADWLKIPVISDGLLPGLDLQLRCKLIDAGLQAVTSGSWKWEYWHGWCAVSTRP